MKKFTRGIVLCFALIMAMAFLAGCGGKKPANYEVLVNDAGGNPVEGVTVQFCSGTECIMGKTDEKGIAVFEKEAGTYTVHVLKVPEGYTAYDTEYTAPAEPGRLTVVIQ